jgi:hypothetical protein
MAEVDKKSGLRNKLRGEVGRSPKVTEIVRTHKIPVMGSKSCMIDGLEMD